MLKATPNFHFRGQGKQAMELYKQAFDLMADGATIIYPIQATEYSSCFVSLVDKFGMRWELMTEQTER